MIVLEHKDGGTCVGDKLFLGDTFVEGRICLCTKKGEMMNYGQGNTKIVSFPGEYDIDDISIKCIDAGDVLHYVIHVDEKWIAILQSSAALEKENIEGIDVWVVSDESIKKEIENLELDGEIMLIGAEQEA